MSQNPITFWSDDMRHLSISRLWVGHDGVLTKYMSFVLWDQIGPDPEDVGSVQELWTMLLEDETQFIDAFADIQRGQTRVLAGRKERDHVQEAWLVMSKTKNTDQVLLTVGTADKTGSNVHSFVRDWQNFCAGLKLLFPMGELGI